MTRLVELLRESQRPDKPLTRAAYLAAGLTLAAVKYAGDVTLVYMATSRLWSPLAYLYSLPYLLSPQFSETPRWLLPTMALWALPFIAVGVVLTMRRAVDAGRTPWLALWFFVPYANYVVMTVLCLWPSATRQPRQGAPQGSDSMLRASARALSAGLSVGLAMVGLAVFVTREYSAPLFLGTPYVMGAVTAFVLHQRRDASMWETARLNAVMFVLTGALLVGIAIEGAICVLMGLPLAIVIGWLGALLGRSLVTNGVPRSPGILALIALPAALIADSPDRVARAIHEVRSSIEISASRDRVWASVVAFSPIPPPTDFLFRSGIAYPESARIDGEGVGAVRYCIFSTGAFVEPITRWEPGRRLSFDVAESPAPLRELSPYPNLAPPHLDGYLRTLGGEFRLVPTPEGHTRLEGSTWYQIDMAPEGYWQLWADALIHRIHLRVLAHVKAEAER
jgi:hypothetical protein